MKTFNIVTGCAGFIDSNLLDSLLEDLQNCVIGLDNNSTEIIKLITKAKKSGYDYNT